MKTRWSISVGLLVMALAWPAAAARESVTITAYNPVVAQTDSTPLIAKCGRVRVGTVALSRDLWRRYRLRCGDKIEVRIKANDLGRLGVGHVLTWMRMLGLKPPRHVHLVMTVWDSMARRWTRRVDLFMWAEWRARKWGRRRGRISLDTDTTGGAE